MTKSFPNDNAGMRAGLVWIREYFEKKKISGKKTVRLNLVAEETLRDLIAHADKGGSFQIRIRQRLGSITLDFVVPGEEYNFIDKDEPLSELLEIGIDSESDETYWEEIIRNRILRAYGNDLKYRYKKGVNKVRMTVLRSASSFMHTLVAILAAIFAGIIMTMFISPSMINAVDSNFLAPCKTMYINALKMLAAPVVFFSIATCVSELTDLTELGRIGAKIMGMYLLTTFIAVCVGVGVSLFFEPGDPSMMQTLGGEVPQAASNTMDVSIKSLIIGIIPDNIVKPFAESNMLQIVFMAILFGIAIGLIGDYSRVLREILDACNEMLLKTAMIIMQFTPIAVFCSILSLILKMGFASMLSLLGMIGTFLCGLICMVFVYSLLLLISGINPLRFLNKYFPTMLQVFSMAASSASIPLNMKFCKDEMGISAKIYTFSIPLGATVNMDGTCIMLVVEALTLARIYGVTASTNMIVSLCITIVLLSVGAPGVPGAGVIMVSMLLAQMGVPVEAVALVIGIGPLMGMFISASNCLGDVVVTTGVAKHEKMIRTES